MQTMGHFKRSNVALLEDSTAHANALWLVGVWILEDQ